MADDILQPAQITWYINTEDGIVPSSDYYLGNVSTNNILQATIYLWNNRWGRDNVLDMTNIRLKIDFDKIENSYLLENTYYTLDNGSYQKINKFEDNIGYIDIDKTIKGSKNDGSLNNNDNYCIINLKITIPNGAREELKNFFITPEYQ